MVSGAPPPLPTPAIHRPVFPGRACSLHLCNCRRRRLPARQHPVPVGRQRRAVRLGLCGGGRRRRRRGGRSPTHLQRLGAWWGDGWVPSGRKSLPRRAVFAGYVCAVSLPLWFRACEDYPPLGLLVSLGCAVRVCMFNFCAPYSHVFCLCTRPPHCARVRAVSVRVSGLFQYVCPGCFSTCVRVVSVRVLGLFQYVCLGCFSTCARVVSVRVPGLFQYVCHGCICASARRWRCFPPTSGVAPSARQCPREPPTPC